jgi:hypothetical protein
VGAAVALRDVVGEGQHVLVVGVVPPQRHLDGDAVLLAGDVDRGLDQRLLGAVEIADELDQAALVEQFGLAGIGMAVVGQLDADAGIEEGQLAQAVLQRVVVELDIGEGVLRRREGDLGAGVVAGVAGDLQRAVGDAVGEAHLVELAVAADLQLQRDRQRVDDGDADAVQAAGDLVGVLVELTAGMQLGHDDLGRGDALLGVDVDGDAAAVVGDGHRTVDVERHGDEIGMAGQRLVDGVVHNLVDHVMQAGTVVGVADIHARALAHRVEALEDLDGAGAVLGGIDGNFFRNFRRFGHMVQSFPVRAAAAGDGRRIKRAGYGKYIGFSGGNSKSPGRSRASPEMGQSGVSRGTCNGRTGRAAPSS